MINKERFEAIETCTRCGQSRVRGLMPADELQLRLDKALARGSAERRRLRYELRYEESKSGRFASRATKVRAQLAAAQRRVLDEIKREKGRGKVADRQRIKELRMELRGLIWGK